MLLHIGRLEYLKVKTMGHDEHYVILFHSAVQILCKHCEQIFLYRMLQQP